MFSDGSQLPCSGRGSMPSVNLELTSGPLTGSLIGLHTSRFVFFCRDRLDGDLDMNEFDTEFDWNVMKIKYLHEN